MMSERKWEVVAEVYMQGEADILGGLLKAQGFMVHISQEGYVHNALVTTVGAGSKIDILVPDDQAEEAKKLIDEYAEGTLLEDTEE